MRGEVPMDLRGTLSRNSPNPQFAPRDKNHQTDDFKREQFDELSGDFPRLDERFALIPYRYGYFAARAGLASRASTCSRPMNSKRASDRHTPLRTSTRSSELVFVPRGVHANEGNGYLLATIYRATEKRSDLAIFDAMTLADGPNALAELSHRVTLGFHGNWMGA
jgi:carotenoid cleavage dioxygenase-like enzyme